MPPLKRFVKKICLLGDPAVGKTSLIRKFVYDAFDDRYLSTIGAKITKKVVNLKRENLEIRLMIWDIAGQHTFSNLKGSYFKGATGALIVCDVTRSETVKNLETWVASLFDVTGDIPILFMANKSDLLNKTQFDEKGMEDFASRFNTQYFLTSAKTGINVEQSFAGISKMMTKDAITEELSKAPGIEKSGGILFGGSFGRARRKRDD